MLRTARFTNALAWVDQSPSTLNPTQRARLRVQHGAVLSLLLIGTAYTIWLTWLGAPEGAVSVLLMMVAGHAALFYWTRRGAIQKGGVALSVVFFVHVVAAMVGRGEMQSNAWMLLAPVLAGLMAGPKHAAQISAAVVLTYIALWSAQQLGLPLPALPKVADPYISLVDYPAIALIMGVCLWAQAGIWERTLQDTDQANAELRAQVQERERAQQSAVDSAQARYTFLATMSHEIRTPLNGVLGLTEVLMDSELNADQLHLARTVHSSGRLLRALLDDVLDFSKIDSGHMELEQCPVDLPALCKELIQLWQPAALEQGLRLDSRFAPGAPTWIQGDPTKLRQILGNIVSNALKFTHQGSVRLRVSTEGQRLLISVHDTGIGISPSAASRVFDAFMQSDGTPSRRHGGTGLGLAISKRLSQLMSGDIRLQSTPGQGSTFTLDLPLVLATPAASPSVKQSIGDSLRGLNVLVAEDNPVNQLVIRRLLERHGVVVMMASDGEDCLVKWQRCHPDIILMDCQMPVCDGYQATRRIRAMGGTLPIIALTANSMAGDRERCLLAGMNEHLGKPIDALALVAVLSQWQVTRSAQIA